MRTRSVLAGVVENGLQGRVVDMDAERLNLGVVEQVLPFHAGHCWNIKCNFLFHL